MYRAGISFKEFGCLTMTEIRTISKAYSEKLSEEFKLNDIMAFVQGRYIVDALLCTVGNMFGGKNAKFEYPEQAYSLNSEEKELTEEEIQNQRVQFMAMLQTMERNFNLNKEREKNGKR